MVRTLIKIGSRDGSPHWDHSPGQPKRQRVITEKRREQNRQAQKAHREKQKRRLQELSSVESQPQNLETSRTCQSIPGPSSGHHEAVRDIEDSWRSSVGILRIDSHVTPPSTDSLKEAEMPYCEPEGSINQGKFVLEVGCPESPLGAFLNEDNSDINWPQESLGSLPSLDSPMARQLLSSVSRNPSIEFEDFLSESTFRESSQWNSASSHISDELSPDYVNQIIAENRISIDDIIFAGLESITQKYIKSSMSKNSQSRNFNDSGISAQQLRKSTASTSHTPSLPLRQMALMAACLANAAHIGIDIYEHIRQPSGHCGGHHTISPFFQPALASSTLTSTIIASLYPSTIPDLRPCTAQIKQSHFLYIDTIPIPDFRKRILALRSCVTDSENGEDGEKVFDEEEFCRDIDADGIVCWGSNAKVGTGAPWDRRSWEMRPWFLKKWWMVTGGLEGEMGKQSRWWADMRGEIFDEG